MDQQATTVRAFRRIEMQDTVYTPEPERFHQLLKKKPYLVRWFGETARQTRVDHYRFTKARNGQDILEWKWDGASWKPLSSAYDPGREADRMMPADAQRWSGREVIVLLGLGNLEILGQLSEHLRPEQILIAVDSSEELLLFLAQSCPRLLQILEQPGRHVFAGRPGTDILKHYLDTIPGERLRGVRVISHSPSRKLTPSFYDQVEQMVKETMQSRLSDILTRFEFEKSWMRNIILNSTGFHPDRTMDVALLSGALRHRPAFLVSAGPSLKESLPILKRWQDRIFILSTDTALKALLRGGIRPHIVFTLDAQKQSLYHYLGESISETTLVADIVTHPTVLRHVGTSRRLFSTTEKYTTDASGRSLREVTPGTEYLESIYGSIAGLQSGGSVATSAFDLLRHMEASPIMLIGQDLAYTGRKIHSTGTHHNERWLPGLSRVRTLEWINEAVIRKRKTFQVPALDGGTILTDYVLDMYRHWFEDAIESTQMEVWNCSARGATIAGAYRPRDLESELHDLARNQVQTHTSNSSTASDPPMTLPHTGHSAAAASIVGGGAGFSHERNKKLGQLLEQTVHGKATLEAFFVEFPELRRIDLRASIYVTRNREKLDAGKADEVYRKRVLEDLQFIYHSIKKDPFFSEAL